MAIRIIEGVPGTGKSYYACKHLRDNYFRKDTMDCWEQIPMYSTDVNGDFKLDTEGKKIEQKLVISTNLEGLKLPHVSLLEEVKTAGGVRVFFSHAYQEQIEKDNERRLYIIDEAQQIFRQKTTGDYSDVWFYFEKHRHFGHDIYLLTQNAKKINSELSLLAEYHVRAKPRVRSMFGEFPYQMLSDGEIVKRFSYKPDQEVFDLYKSRRKTETEKIKNPVMITVIKVSIAAVIVGVLGVYGLKYLMTKDVKGYGEAQASVEPVESNNKLKQGNIPIKEKIDITDIMVPVSMSVLYEKQRPINYLFIYDKYYHEKDFPFPIVRKGKTIFARVSSEDMLAYFPSKVKKQEKETIDKKDVDKIVPVKM